jgi:hypothetical protein
MTESPNMRVSNRIVYGDFRDEYIEFRLPIIADEDLIDLIQLNQNGLLFNQLESPYHNNLP